MDGVGAGQIPRANFQSAWVFYIRDERGSATLCILSIHYRAVFGKVYFDCSISSGAFKSSPGLIIERKSADIKKLLFIPEKKMAMNVVMEIDGVRRKRWADRSVTWGLVPTMGFLHEGHLELVRRARVENDRVGVSIFVNPIQFNSAEDLEKYPRNMDRDSALLEKEGVDLLWTPTPEIMYPRGYQTYVNVNHVTTILEGAARPGHFQGVATVVAKLFNVFQPTRAYFGQKDAQQLVVIRRMAKDLDFNLQIIACPTVRENDGLAMSSRNVRLTPEHRCQAVCLYKALSVAGSAFRSGIREAVRLREMMTDVISDAPTARIDYVSVADPETLVELETIEAGALLSMAVFFGDVRLIDNLVLSTRM